mgnify:FL=1
MAAISFALVLAGLRGLREGFLPGERFVLAATWIIPMFVFWLNRHYLPLSPLLLLCCFSYFVARIYLARPVEGPRTPLTGGGGSLAPRPL